MIKPTPLWKPDQSRTSSARMSEFAAGAGSRFSRDLSDSTKLHAWSINHMDEFWSYFWDFCKVIGEKGDRILIDAEKMPGARFFPDASLNYAENLLRKSGDNEALVFRGEDKAESRISWNQLAALTSRFQQALKAAGVSRGDRVAAMMPNMIETIAAVAATASLGAIWSSCSPDFGYKGVMDRFGQINPKVFLACDGYWYNGKRIEISDKLERIIPDLGAEQSVIIPYLNCEDAIVTSHDKCRSLAQFLSPFEAKQLEFERVPFDHPLFILFSSGTTGIPKCIVHSHGGCLLMHMKEQQLHYGVGEGDRLFYFTTCGWMMWNWLVTGLAAGATLMLYDGSPFAPSGEVLFDYAEQEKFTLFGTSAKFIDAVRKSGLSPIRSHDLSSIDVITSTGSPLAPENFEFVYSDIKADVHLASMSGGTDIAACFVGGDPLSPVYKGEIQGAGLGMAVEVWDDQGNKITGEKGELVCVRPFPSVPVQFWNDEDGSKYHNAYFARFDNVWCHGDFAEITQTGGMIIHGRSDATLNPGGVRIGTAEIYNVVEQMPEIAEALCIGQQWEGDVRIILFVRLADDTTLDEDLMSTIKSLIRKGASPRHVPAKIIAVTDIPRTKSGKITELAVRDIVHGIRPKNQEALANPEALDLFENLAELSS